MSSYDAAIAILAGPAAAGSSKAAASSALKPDASSKAAPDTSAKSDDGLISPLAALALVVVGLGGFALWKRGKAEAIETEGSEILSASPAGWAALNASEYPRADNPAAWVQDEAIWEQAKAEVLPDWGRYDQPWAVVTHVYERMGGRIAA